jgi:hypothetical protein
MAKNIGQIDHEAYSGTMRATSGLTPLEWHEIRQGTREAAEAGALAVQRHTLEQLESAGVPGVGQLIGAMRGGKTLEEAIETRKDPRLEGCDCDPALKQEDRCDVAAGMMRCLGAVRAWQERNMKRAREAGLEPDSKKACYCGAPSCDICHS